MLGLLFYTEKTGSLRALWLLALWVLLLAAGCLLMGWGVRRRRRGLRIGAYALTLLSALAAAVGGRYFNGGGALGQEDPVWELMLCSGAAILFAVLFLAFICWGFHQRVKELTGKD